MAHHPVLECYLWFNQQIHRGFFPMLPALPDVLNFPGKQPVAVLNLCATGRIRMKKDGEIKRAIL